MKIKSLALLAAATLCITPVAAFADFIINNNTNTAATAFAGKSPCSNAAGDRGVIKPHGQVQVPDFAVGLYCRNDCIAQVFMSKNCSGKSIASVTLNQKDGVTKIENNDNGADGYRVVGFGKNMSIEGGPARKWYQIFS